MNLLQQFFSNRWFYHSAFWLLYSGFWHWLFAPNFFSFFSILVSLIYLFYYLIGSYTNNYFLIPRYFNNKQYGKYVLLVVLLILSCSALLGISLDQYFSWLDPNLSLFNQDRNYLLGAVFGSTFSTIALTMSIKLIKQRIEFEQKEKEKNQQRLETELKLLKDQLNPHFLFNAINSIYVLIKKDPEIAAEALAQFSDMLRYQLYECDQSSISLKKEVEFLQNYIHLAALRKEHLDLNTYFDPNIQKEKVPPMLLTPLVENAFKHVSSFSQKPNWIDIKLCLNEVNKVQLTVSNSFDMEEKTPTTIEAGKSGGIGLSNIKRRLSLLYPNNHQIDIDHQDSIFSVKLEIPTNQNDAVKLSDH